MALDRIVVVIPARDEGPTISTVIDDVRTYSTPLCDELHIVVVADRCTDATADTAARRGAIVCTNDGAHAGLGDVYRTGMRAAMKLQPTVIVQIDADGQYGASVIPALCHRISDGADLAVANRLWHRPVCMTRSRFALNLLASRLLGVALGARMPDSQSGCRALVPAVARLSTSLRHTYTQEQIVLALRAGLRVDHVNCSFHARVHGTSRVVPSAAGYAARVLPGLIHILLSGGKVRRRRHFNRGAADSTAQSDALALDTRSIVSRRRLGGRPSATTT
jgi:glycosyltransferase involved in cell wall biosynthesis